MGRETPNSQWKRIDVVQDVLPQQDKGVVNKTGGVITAEDYGELVG